VVSPADAAAFLAGDAGAVAEVTGWIRQAATPFRRRLAFEWDDLLQDALVRLTADLRGGRYRGDGPLRAYVWRAVNHACIDRLRRHRRWKWTGVEDLELAAEEPSPQALAVGRDATRRVLALVAELPSHCRELWAMVLEGLSYREMSERVAVAEGTLRVRVLRCRERLLTRWKDVTAGPATRHVSREGSEESDVVDL
jgi:RNA polymerase sigma-70 factor (ECF subfamily)